MAKQLKQSGVRGEGVLAPHTTLPGRDHRSLLLFLQTVEANNGGDVRHADTRGCAAGYPTRMRNKRLVSGEFAWDGKAGTRYDGGRRDGDHDDYDCMYDLIEWGFVEEKDGSTGLHPFIRLTDKGHAACAALIRERGEQTRGGS